jgi:glucose/arabinose dehydrogenase
MAFDPSGRLFFTERGGAVRLIVNDILQASPVITFAVDACNERGLLGIALDPAFSQNHYIYVQYTAPSPCTNSRNKTVRFVENNGVGSNPVEIFDTTFTGVFHSGNNIHFGPDGKLYISNGDNSNASTAQDLADPHGKLHRINPDGTIPTDNPFFGHPGVLPSVFALGLRNSFDFVFDPVVTGRIFASENGPDCDDEVNRIEGGYDYGWRANYPCDDSAPGGPDPHYNTIPPMWYVPEGPCCLGSAGIEVYTGTLFPQWRNDLFMCAFNDGLLRHFYLSDDRASITRVAAVSGVTCNVDLQTAPDGALYYIEAGGKFSGSLMRVSLLSPTPTSTPGGPTPSPTTCTVAFSDVLPGSTFYPYVRCLACMGIISGYPDGTFRPNSLVTRGQLAKIVSNAAGYDDPTGTQLFQDVPPATSPYYIWVQRLANRGFISGYLCGDPGEPCAPPDSRPYFRPFAPATRGQLTKIVAEAAGLSSPPGPQLFEDVLPASPFYTYTQRLAALNVISGYPCSGPGEPCIPPDNRPYFRPANNSTRGQIAKIVSNTFFPGCTVP